MSGRRRERLCAQYRKEATQFKKDMKRAFDRIQTTDQRKPVTNGYKTESS